jgi:DNA polymerase-3 subunit alpha
MEFSDWITEYKLQITRIDEFLFEIQDFGKLLLIYGDNGKIINKDFHFIMTDEDFRRVDKTSPDFFCYQFGLNWYYSKIIKKIDKNSVVSYEVEMNMLKNIGFSEEDIGFCHLGIHSEYEILSGNGDLEDWVKKAHFLKHKSLGICDKNTLAGTLALQSHCEKFKIKSILGETVTVQYSKESDSHVEEVKLYVKNELGWRNLLRINKQINVDNHEHRYIEKSKLLSYSEGLILVFTKESLIYKIRDYKEIVKYLNSYDSFEEKYYQIDTVEYDSDETDIKNLESLSFYFNNFCDLIEPVLINDSYYIDRNNYNAKNYIDSITRVANPKSKSQYYKDGKESIELLYALFNQDKQYCSFSPDELIDKMIQNLSHISDNCNYKIDTGNHKLPKYDSGKDNNELFFELIQEGIEKKLKDVDIDKYLERIEKECDLIIKSGFVDYFLILWDFVKWSKSNDIDVGTGRGSVAGCLVAYLIDITTIDPIKHDLLFERFMNETRMMPEEWYVLSLGDKEKSIIKGTEVKLSNNEIKLVEELSVGDDIVEFKGNKIESIKVEKRGRQDQIPDVDVDFLSDRRDEVKRYISQRYGVNNTCSIGAYTTMKLKGALKDFSRAKGLDFKHVNFVTSKIPNQLEYEWADLFKYAVRSEIIRDFVQKNNDVVDVIQYTLKQPRAISIHASAVVITPKFNSKGESMTVFDWLPIRKVDGFLVSEWEGKYIDKAGFLKEDILALNTLDKFKMTLNLIERDHGDVVKFEELPLDDEATYKLFKKGYTEDIFQFGSDGLKQYSKLVKPDNIEELIAMNALYRPGPMKSNAHTDFADIKFGRKKPDFDPLMEVVTKHTYGLYVYQEQIMQAMVVAGMTLIEADMVRTQIKKFDKVAMNKFKDKFVSLYAEKLQSKISKESSIVESNRVWDKLMMFSSYGFNKSHSAAYSLMSYWCQYLKAHYPLQFWTTAFDKAGEEDIPNILSEMFKVSKHIKVIPPDINKSITVFDCDKNTNSIYWSLSKIKGLASNTVEHIIQHRSKTPFKNLSDFISRVEKSKVNKAKVFSLILSGCFDNLYGITIDNPSKRLEIIIEYVELTKNYDLLDKIEQDSVSHEFYWKIKQKELTGLGFIDYESILSQKVRKKFSMYYTSPKDFFDGKKDYQKCFIAGILRDVYERDSKRGKFAFITLDNNDFVLEGNIWNETYKNWQDKLPKLKGKMIALSASIKYDTFNNRNKNIFHTNEFTEIFEL